MIGGWPGRLISTHGSIHCAPLPLTSRKTMLGWPWIAWPQACSTSSAPWPIEELSTPTLTTVCFPSQSWRHRSTQRRWKASNSARDLMGACVLAGAAVAAMPHLAGRARRDSALDDLVQRFGCELAVVDVVHLDQGRQVADAEATVHHLQRQLAIGGRLAIADAPGLLQVLDELLGAEHVAGHAVAEHHEVVAARL